MATTGQIDAAMATGSQRTVGSIEGHHLLSMSYADAQREAEYRRLAARAVRRLGGEDAAEMLAALGLEASGEQVPCVNCTHPDDHDGGCRARLNGEQCPCPGYLPAGKEASR